jgi:ABC-type multidrug transport system fused ATPase/permease subunit
LLTARQAGAHEVIARLKHDYDTRLGKWLEEGEELSIRVWRKIALAEAFLRNAQIIVLDELTSALDAKIECEVFQKFHQLTQGRMAILISHQPSTILVCCGGKYAQLFALQAQSYR